MRTVTDDERRARLGVRHGLAAPLGDTESVVRAMTCLHATEQASVYLSAFARSGATRGGVDHALYEQRSVVRQLAMRRTVFVFPRDLLPAVRASASARVASQLAARLAKDVVESGICADGVAWVRDTCAQTLELLRREPATTAQLRARLPRLELRVRTSDSRGVESPVAPHLVSVLAADGAVVRGRNAAGWKVSRPVWTPVEDWLGGDGGGDGPDAVAGYAELVGRWLRSFGPGTEDDLVWWLGATKGAVRRALADVGATECRLADGSTAWLHPDDRAEVAPPGPWAALLPALDPTTMGWRTRGFYLGDLADQVFEYRGNAGPTAWWNGRIVGSWTQEPDGTVVVVPAADLPHDARGPLEDRATELTAWLDGDLVNTAYPAPVTRARSPTARTTPPSASTTVAP